ncbi:hypothetical protein CTAYLR_000906 [Chrysophaeum taylorii]|uniref:Receptor ligand binding region domain-containing protein n=1 Tax=Chrysophaeum taylorii TaxID=2483200 RepID=A0AAD7UHM0_9STRA|nr:hypothetical protein CTAYLR_000906 [Chrysophaeum taylorii]
MAEARYELADAVNLAKLAMKHANDDGVLAAWNLSVDMKFWNTAGSIGGSLGGAIELLKDPWVVGIIGTEDSATTESAAKYASLAGRPMLSPGATGPELIKKEGMEMLFRSSSTQERKFKVIAQLARLYEWSQVGVIAARDENGYEGVDVLDDELNAVGSSVAAIGMFEVENGRAIDVKTALRGIEAVGVHVYVFLSTDYARDVLDGLEDLGILDGPNAFVGLDLTDVPRSKRRLLKGWLFVNVVDSSGDDVRLRFDEAYSEDTTRWNCSRGVQKLFGSLAEEPIIWDFAADPSNYPDASPKIVSSDVMGCVDGDGDPDSDSGEYYYDAAWILIFALRRVLEKGGDATDGEALRAELLETDWCGIRSYYSFDPKSRDAVTRLRVVNVVVEEGGAEDVVTVFETTNQLNYNTSQANESDCLVAVANVTWSNGNTRPGPPRDGRQVSAFNSYYSNALEVYQTLGNASSVTVHLSSFFERTPLYGTLLILELYDLSTDSSSEARGGTPRLDDDDDDSLVAWTDTYVAPGGVNEAQIPIFLPDWGTYEFVARDAYDGGIAIGDTQLPIAVTQPTCYEDDEGYDAAAGGCVKCAAGREKADNVCTDCQPGRYRADGSAGSSCLVCSEEEYQPEYGSTTCLSCPANSTRHDYEYQVELAARGVLFSEIDYSIGVSIEQCLCKEGYYASTGPWKRDDVVTAKTAGASWGDNGTSCEPCPTGGYCSGKTYPPANKNQYWGDPHNPVAFELCDQARCARNYRCKAGYRGRLCSRLRTYKFFTIGGITRHCWFQEKKKKNALSFFVYLLLFCAILSLWVWVNLFLDSLAITIFVQHIQSIAIISQFGVDYPRRPIAYFGVLFNFALFDADIVTPSCIFKWSQLSTFYLSIFIALLGLLFYCVPLAELAHNLIRNDSLCRSYFGGIPPWRVPYRLYIMLRVEFSYYRGSVGKEAATATANALSLLDAIYPNLCFNFMRMLTRDKDTASTASYTRMDATLRWGSPRHVPAAFIALVGCVLVVVGLPVGIFVTIRNNYNLYHGVHEPPSLARWGWAYADFRSPYHATAVMSHLETVVFCTIATAFQDSALQTVLALTTATAAFAYAATVRPFVEFRYNIFFVVAKLAVLIFVVASVLLSSRRYRTAWTVITAAELFLFFVVTVNIYVMERAEGRKRAEIKSGMGRVLNLPTQRMSLRSRPSLVVNAMIGEVRRFSKRRRFSSSSLFLGQQDDNLPPKVVEAQAAAGADEDVEKAEATRGHELAATARAVKNLTRVVEPCCMMAWCNNPGSQTDDKKDFVQRVARSTETLISASSPLSQYSADRKAAFWRSLTENYRGIVGFVANTLTYNERVFVFGVLVKLQRFLGNLTLDELALDDSIAESHRASVLYCILSAPAGDDSLTQFLRDALQALKQRGPPPPFCVERSIFLPASIRCYVRGRNDGPHDAELLQEKTSREMIDEQKMQRNQAMLAYGRMRRAATLRHLSPHHKRKIVEFEYREEAAIFYIERFNHEASSLHEVMMAEHPVSPDVDDRTAACEEEGKILDEQQQRKHDNDVSSRDSRFRLSDP